MATRTSEMPVDNPPSIADGSDALRAHRLPWIVGAFALVCAAIGAVHYASLDLTLSHYDARGHLIVARRIVDSLTPGWRQIGAVWLPLPHVLDLPAVWTDWGYQTGYLAVGISAVATAFGLAALSAYLLRATESRTVAVAAPALVLANPNTLYLTSTPMTEPLLLALSFVSVYAVDRWTSSGNARDLHRAGWCLAALALTRYEGWLVSFALTGCAFALSWTAHGWRALTLGAYVVAAILSFFVLGWATTGSWFVTSGFFENDPATAGRVFASAARVVSGVLDLGGTTVTVAALFGAGIVTWLATHRAARAVLSLTLVAAGMLPVYAFFQGHPYRIRYMVPLAAAAAVLAAVALSAVPPRLRRFAAVLLLTVAVYERRPLDPGAPMVVEAQWETPYRRGREAVTAYLGQSHDGMPILASMGSLGHYMQEASRAGFPLATFLHEGNGDLWRAALDAPERYVTWVLIEERAEGGDLLFGRTRSNADYLIAFDRVAEGGGMVLYRRRTR